MPTMTGAGLGVKEKLGTQTRSMTWEGETELPVPLWVEISRRLESMWDTKILTGVLTTHIPLGVCCCFSSLSYKYYGLSYSDLT